MDWQQIAALVVVALTALLFVVTRFLPRRPKWARHTHCGCTGTGAGAGVGTGAKAGRIIVRSRRGDARQTIIHTA